MSDILRLREKGLSYDDIEALIAVADGLRSARQIAYNYAKDRPNLMPTYGDANSLYEGFCRMHDLTAVPAFDEAEHIKQRIAERDPDFIAAYPKENAAYLATLPNGGMRVSEPRPPRFCDTCGMDLTKGQCNACTFDGLGDHEG